MSNDVGLVNEEEAIIKKDSYGTISFADEVISTIAGLATVDIDGVAGMSGKLVDGFTEFLGRKNFSKGIKVEAGKEDVIIGVNIVVNYGVSIPEVCTNIQKSVAKAVETMTGLHVTEVNVGVLGIAVKDSPLLETSTVSVETQSNAKKEKRVK